MPAAWPNLMFSVPIHECRPRGKNINKNNTLLNFLRSDQGVTHEQQENAVLALWRYSLRRCQMVRVSPAWYMV